MGQAPEMPPFPIKKTGGWVETSLSLLDAEGRLASIERLYEYAGEQPSPRDDVAGGAIRHLHPEILPRDAETRKPGELYDRQVSSHEQHQSLDDLVLSTPRGSKTFAACHKDVCVSCLI